MDIDLRTIVSADDARPHLEILKARAQEALGDLGSETPRPDFMERFLESSLAEPESLLIVAESAPGLADLGLCLVGPHVDPLSGLRSPMVLVLSVDSKVRHRGLAGALVKEARRVLGRRGYDQLTARCAHGDDALVSMGERWGFIRTWEVMAK